MRAHVLVAAIALLIATAAPAQNAAEPAGEPTGSTEKSKAPTAGAQQTTAPTEKQPGVKPQKQPASMAGAKAQGRIAELQARLKLTPEQSEKLRPILQQEMEELRAVREKYVADTTSAAKQAMKTEMKSVHEKYEGQIAAILTPEQTAEWNKIKQERGDKQDRAFARLVEYQSRLKLTPEQSEKLRPIVEEEMEQFQAVRAKYASDTSKKAKRSMMREMKSIQDRYSGQIAAVLTPEQMAEWKKIKEERKQELKEKRAQ